MPINLDFSGTDNGFGVLDEGVYEAFVYDIEERMARSGNKMLTVVYSIPSENNQRLWDNYVIVDQALWKLKGFLQACGIPGEELEGKFELDPNLLLGRPVFIEVGQTEYQGKLRNEVSAVFSAETEGVAANQPF